MLQLSSLGKMVLRPPSIARPLEPSRLTRVSLSYAQIRKDKSHLLQSFRFMVNNNFFLEWPQQPLKYFEWQSNDELEEGGNTGAEGAPEAVVQQGEAEGEEKLDDEEDGSDYESAGEDDEEAALEVMLG